MTQDQQYAQYANELADDLAKGLSDDELVAYQALAKESLVTLRHLADSDVSAMRVALAVSKMLAAIQTASLENAVNILNNGIVSYMLAAASLADGVPLPPAVEVSGVAESESDAYFMTGQYL